MVQCRLLVMCVLVAAKIRIVTKTCTNQATCTTYPSSILYLASLKQIKTRARYLLQVSFTSDAAARFFKIGDALFFFVLRARICRFLALGRTDVVAAKTRPMPPVQRDQNASLCHLLFIYLFILHATSCAGGAKGNWLLKSTMFC